MVPFQSHRSWSLGRETAKKTGAKFRIIRELVLRVLRWFHRLIPKRAIKYWEKKVWTRTAWWFGTFFCFFYILGIVTPTDELRFFRGVETTNEGIELDRPSHFWTEVSLCFWWDNAWVSFRFTKQSSKCIQVRVSVCKSCKPAMESPYLLVPSGNLSHSHGPVEIVALPMNSMVDLSSSLC